VTVASLVPATLPPRRTPLAPIEEFALVGMIAPEFTRCCVTLA
jgi:hypothetical protein